MNSISLESSILGLPCCNAEPPASSSARRSASPLPRLLAPRRYFSVGVSRRVDSAIATSVAETTTGTP